MKIRKMKGGLGILFAAGLILAWMSTGFSGMPQAKKNQFKYVGVLKCKMCHNSPRKGNQYKIWKNSPHAKAYEELGTEKAKAVAKKMGIADPQKSPKCLKCHVTGYGLPKTAFGPRYHMENGVTCEACHGPGSAYWKVSVMRKIYKGQMDGSKVGYVRPNEQTCKKCHNPESPTYKKFVYATFWKKIAHDIPKK